MKKYQPNITSATQPTLMFIEGAFNGLESDAYNSGYNMKITRDFQVALTARKDTDHMPIITVNTLIEDEAVYFEPAMTFPVLDSSKLDYYDSIHYWIGRWADVSNFITQLCKFKYDPTQYEEYYDEMEKSSKS